MDDNIYINGVIKTITLVENTEVNTKTFRVNGKHVSQEKGYKYLKEFIEYKNWILEKHQHPNNNHIIIRSYRLQEV